MKLRNKHTGEIWGIPKMRHPTAQQDGISFFAMLGTNGELFSYRSIAKLKEEWEDAGPLIKDEKIRKAVRAWAEANGIGGCICKEEIHCITFETERGMFISFEDADPIPPEGNFTIAELCGEEEAPEPIEPAFIDLDERIKAKGEE